MPHDESMKFKLLGNPHAFERKVFETTRDRGTVNIRSNHSCIQKKFNGKRLTGRNKELYGLFEILRNKEKKFAILRGIEGVGKTTLVK